MFEDDEKMREQLLELSEKLDPHNSETERGEGMRSEVSRNLIRLINTHTPHRVTRVMEAEHQREDEELPDMIEEAIEHGQEIYEEYKQAREELKDEYGVEMKDKEENGYSFEYDGDVYGVSYAQEILQVKKDGEWFSAGEVEIPDEAQDFVSKYWDTWSEYTSKMAGKMEEIGFQLIGQDGHYADYRVGDYGTEVMMGGDFPLNPSDFSVKTKEITYWDPYQLWARFENPQEKLGEGETR